MLFVQYIYNLNHDDDIYCFRYLVVGMFQGQGEGQDLRQEGGLLQEDGLSFKETCQKIF